MAAPAAGDVIDDYPIAFFEFLAVGSDCLHDTTGLMPCDTASVMTRVI
jgi:hypothetical protein